MNNTIHWLPILPVWMIVAIGAGLFAGVALGSILLLRKKVPTRWVAMLGGWRILLLTVFLIALGQPVLSYVQTGEQRPEMIVMVDTSRNMAQPGVNAPTRLAEIVPALEQGSFAQELQRRYHVHYFAFDAHAHPLDDGKLADLKSSDTPSCYSESLTNVVSQLRARNVTPERVLLASAGNDAGQADPVETAQRLGLIVDTLAPSGVEPTATDSAVSIADVQCARRVLLGSETHFRVTLQHPQGRGAGGPAQLSLTEDGKNVWSQAVTFKRGATEQRVPVVYRPTTAGVKRYEFHLTADGVERPPYALSVQVTDSRHEVLVLEDTWRWEFKFLRRVFEDDPSFRFTAFLARGGNAFVQFGAPDRRVNLVGFPQGRADLEGFDTIVLGDVNVKRWPRELAAAIGAQVRDEGKSLIILAGPNLASIAENADLNALLPVDVARETPTPLGGPVEVRVSPDGKNSPLFSESANEGSLADAKLPPLDQIYPPLRKRPGATVLLEAAKQANNSFGNLIVMAEQTVGRGRVLYVGTDTLWKWQTLAPETASGTTPYSVFWQQALRALTPERSTPGGVQLWIEANRHRYEVGRTVSLKVEVDSDRPVPQSSVQAAVILPNERRLPLAFAMDPADPGVYRADYQALAPGPHRILATLVAGGRNLAENTTVIDVAPAASGSDSPIDRVNLQRIARSTGGKFVDLAEPQTWPPVSEGARPMVTTARTVDLWNNYSLMLLLCGLLGVDWLVRLWRGYV